MGLAEELEKLEELRRAGSLSEEEFLLAKKRILEAELGGSGNYVDVRKRNEEARWAMMLHLSLLLDFVIPPAGLVVPIVIWQLKKNEYPGLDKHGYAALNFIISYIIYSIVTVFLCFFLVGFFLLPLLILLGIVGPIIVGVSASKGRFRTYPYTITFIGIPSYEEEY